MRLTSLVLVGCFFSVLSASAADSPEPVKNFPAADQGQVDCFDYYHFGSVQVDLSPTLNQTVPGATLNFQGTIKNENAYPIVDGSVYVKIFHVIDEDESLTHRDGYPIVDQFFLPQSFNISAHGDHAASFDWLVPVNASGGEYYAAFFFQSAKRYNLLGLSFTDDVVGNQAPFTVTNPNASQKVLVNKHTVTLNDQEHSFVGFPRHFPGDKDMTAQVNIENPKNESAAVMIEWKLYAWDGLREETLSDTQSQIIELKAGEKKTLSYTIPPMSISVPYLIFRMHDGFSSSFLNIRFVRDDVIETRINFPSVQAYPLKAGQETSVFSCVHSTNLSVVKDNMLTLTLRDEENNVIHSYIYRGDITSAMMGVADTFRPSQNYANFSLTATLERDGALIEEVTQQYRCQDIDPNLCPQLGQTSLVDESMNMMSRVGFIIVGVIVCFGFLVIFVVSWKRRRGMMMVFLSTLLLGIGFSGASVEAKSVTWMSGVMPGMGAFGNNAIANEWKTDPGALSCPSGCGWDRVLLPNSLASITYKATLKNIDTGLPVLDGATISTGTRLRVDAVAKADSDITWFGTGGSMDSPFGYWVNNAGPRMDIGCSAGDYVGFTNIPSMFGVSIGYAHNLFSVHPAAPLRSGVMGNLTCDVAGICTVTGPGALSLGMNYPATYGKFYHRYRWLATDPFGNPFLPESDGVQCHGNNVPLRIMGGWNLEDSCMGVNCLPGPDYQMNVPAQNITFNLTAVDPNQAPNAPTLIGPASGNQSTALTFAATATDPDGDNVRYLFDWNSDGIGDQWSGGGVRVASGTSQSLPYIWATPGTYTFQARTEDSKGSLSGWTQKTVTINAFADGACGVASTSVSGIDLVAAPVAGLCNAGTPTVVSGSGPWTWSCNGIGAGSTNIACQADLFIPAPIVNLSIDRANVDLGDSATLTWSVVNPADTCVASSVISASWNGARATSGSESVTPTASGNYILTCTNTAEGKSGTRTVGITLNNKLKICENSCNSGLDRTGQTFAVNQGADRHLKACFNPHPDCTNAAGDTTNLAVWNDTNSPNNAFSFPAKGELRPLPFNATEDFDVSYGGVTKSASAQVFCVPNSCSIPAAKAVTDTYCPEMVQDTNVPTGCDGNTLNCPGTRHCDYNVKEVAP